MPDNIDKYVPEFDEDEQRERLSEFGREDLIGMLLRAYKEKRMLAKMCDDLASKLSRIEAIAQEPSSLLGLPDIPDAEDLRRMNE